MKVHELINVLNHFPPDAEVDVSDNDYVVHDASDRVFSISKTYDTLKDGTGHSLAVTVEPASNVVPADPVQGTTASVTPATNEIPAG